MDTNVDNTVGGDQKNELTKIDIAFILDCTGSMNPYIQSARDNIVAIANKIESECKNCDASFGLVLYRDIPKNFDLSHPENNANGFITEIYQFTSVPLQIELKLHSVDALGGGDQPECLTSALHSCLNQLNWNKNSIKIIIIITDAPPHGLEINVDDDYPNGDINTFINPDEGGQTNETTKYLNMLDIIKSIRNKLKASIYSVVCEPNISCDFDLAYDFYSYISETTNGQFLPLTKAELLPNVIVGTVKQQISVHDLSQQLQDEIKSIKEEYNNKISNAELNKLIKEKWKNKHVKKKDISIGTLYRKERSRENIDLLLNEQKIQTLDDFKNNATLIPRYTIKDFRHMRSKNIAANADKTKSKDMERYGSDSMLNTLPMRKTFDDLLVGGHDIDGIGQYYASLSVSRDNKENRYFDVSSILSAMLVQKKSRHIGVWRERYLVLFKDGILKTFKSEEMKKSTENIKVEDIVGILQNEKKFERTEFHVVCDKITFKFKAKTVGNKNQLISEIKSMRHGNKINTYGRIYKRSADSLSINSQRAYSVERSVGSRSISRIIRMHDLYILG